MTRTARAQSAPQPAPAVPRWRRLVGSRVVGQAAVYAAASGLAMGLGGIARIILARDLAPPDFGTFAFSVSFLMLTALVFDFGLMDSAARRLARTEARARPELVGASVATFAPMAVAFGLLVFGLSFVVDDVFHADAGSGLRAVSPLAFVYAFTAVGEQIAKGADRLHVFSLSHLAGRVALVAALLALSISGAHYGSTLALAVNSATLLLAVVIFVVWLRPVFRRAVDHARAFLADTRDWAFQLYLGRLFSIGTYNMDILMVAAFADRESTGFYALAAALTGILGLPVVGLGAALFPRMAHEPEIDQDSVLAAAAIGLVGVGLVWLAAPAAIDLVFSAAYAPVAALAVPLALAQGVRGVTTIYNTWLSAQGRGRDLRNTGFILAAFNLALNFALIPPFGAKGAAWASFVALVANLIAHVAYYRRAQREAAAA
jgi:O-antigen/teichoic acid export membrane protein